ncbi:MAG: hypothetical protein LBH32_12110, partial [Dysgonamonadaceae bacterium]|nr:hypothetical protein [Dysgonamonadaceae bacterium]
MKRLYIILLMGIFAGFFARSETVNISPFWGFPLSLDYATIANKQITANRLNPGNIELDSLPRRQIGTIPNQTVWHEGDIAVGFYVLTDTLQSENVQLNYTIDFPPQGKIIFDETTGRFKYFPDKSDVRNFTVTFTAQSDSKLIMQDVKFILMSASPPELSAFGIEALKPAPSANDDYTIIAQTIKKNVQFNNSFKDTVVCLSISGKELIFDNRIQNKLRYLNNRSDIYELNIFAEKVIIR